MVYRGMEMNVKTVVLFRVLGLSWPKLWGRKNGDSKHTAYSGGAEIGEQHFRPVLVLSLGESPYSIGSLIRS